MKDPRGPHWKEELFFMGLLYIVGGAMFFAWVKMRLLLGM